MISGDVSVGTIMKGTITKLASFGAFARVKGGLEGLIHLSELSHEKIDIPSDVVSEGQEVEVKIIKIEEERKRLGLSLLLDKEIEETPAEAEENSSTENVEELFEASEIENEDGDQKVKTDEDTEAESKLDDEETNQDVEDSSDEEKAE